MTACTTKDKSNQNNAIQKMAVDMELSEQI
jgi:hypothetical protein